MNLAACIQHLYPSAKRGDYNVRKVNGEQVVDHWNTTKLGAQPSNQTLTATWPSAQLEQARAAKKREVDEAHKASLAAGITVSGCCLGGDDSSLGKFTGKAVLLDLAIRGGVISPTESTSIRATNGSEVTLPAAQMIQLLLSYGEAYDQKFATLKNKHEQIAAATTIQQLNAIA